MQTFINELNPIYTRIDNINDFSKLEVKNPIQKNEYPHLEKVTAQNVKTSKKMIQKLHNLETELENQAEIIQMETDMDERKSAVAVYNKILENIYECIERINRELTKVDNPYFGKILFKTKIKDQEKILPIYIGRFALMDPNTYEPLISDWRAPIANLYYQNSGPTKDLQFKSPSGIKEGNLVQKRQFNISEARFVNIYDAKSGNVVADEFLLSQLNERLGQKLKDIVATIQKQQNSIIREDINKPVVIQGVAGSGKTTILLHRLAYLFYTYKKEIHPEKTLIIAPNKMFLDYISDVLPSLGIQHVEGNTYMFWAKNILGWNDTYTIHKGKEDLSIKEYKGSKSFISLLDTYFEDFESELLDNIPYSRRDTIRKRYYELKETYPYITMDERLNLSLEYTFAQKQFKQNRTGYIGGKTELEKKKKIEISKYFKKMTIPIDLYRNMFKKGYTSKKISEYTLKSTVRSGKIKTFNIEDLAPILYLYLKIHGHKEYEKEYVMVDEAQDLSLIQILTLLQIAKNQNITIAGDLAQSIIPPFYIKNWEKVTQLFEKFEIKEYSYHQLNRCYRTTLEIIEFANRIFKDRFPREYKLPEAVLRHGEDIRELKHKKEINETDDNDIKNLISIINKEFEKGSVTCALICRDKIHAQKAYKKLIKYKKYFNKEIVDYNQEDYKTGLLILPIENAKGLEFDTVMLLDVNNKTYPDEELSTRLLYVAITRALHRLIVIENSNKSPLLI
jgi:DNA helicase II / ATP-dependent DNA helicase PcrA